MEKRLRVFRAHSTFFFCGPSHLAVKTVALRVPVSQAPEERSPRNRPLSLISPSQRFILKLLPYTLYVLSEKKDPSREIEKKILKLSMHA